jgi:hypothetical protein
MNRSRIHECGKRERDRAVSFLAIHKSDLVCCVTTYRSKKSVFITSYDDVDPESVGGRRFSAPWFLKGTVSRVFLKVSAF